MLSRRSVRVKVMQTLYALSTDDELTFKEATKSYWNSVERTFEILLFNLYIISEITRCSMDDASKRETKHLPTDYDREFTPKLFENDVIQSIIKNEKLRKRFKKLSFSDKVDKDYFKKIYVKFAKTKEYKSYVMNDDTSHMEIVLELYRFCRAEELFNEIIEDNYFTWQDDKSLVIGAFKKCIKAQPTDNTAFFEEFYPDDEAVKDFGEILLERTFEEDNALLKIIKPLLKNWDHDRLALIDTILLKMAIVEFLDFSSIPTKVTLNEYVEVSKMYSTPKSKDFINGVLDKVLKDLLEEGKVKKKGRGLID